MKATYLQVQAAALKAGLDPDYLYGLLLFESGLETTSVNKTSGATGLIQFMPLTAKNLGTTTERIALMSVEQQLELTLRYLRRIGVRPNATLSSMCMAVFYPAYANRPPDTLFPKAVVRANPGIATPRDYVTKVAARAASYNQALGDKLAKALPDLPTLGAGVPFGGWSI
jgi:soluble lytic murein transglycosylase-like protein